MCTNCGQLTGFELDVYSVALRDFPHEQRRPYLAVIERAYDWPGLVDKLGPMLDEHARD